jgi:hypothetical protein
MELKAENARILITLKLLTRTKQTNKRSWESIIKKNLLHSVFIFYQGEDVQLIDVYQKN